MWTPDFREFVFRCLIAPICRDPQRIDPKMEMLGPQPLFVILGKVHFTLGERPNAILRYEWV